MSVVQILGSTILELTVEQPIVQLSSGITVGGSGSVDTASNVGTGVGIFKQKTGFDLEFKSLVAGSNIVLTPGTNDITIASSGVSGLNDGSGTTWNTGASAYDLGGVLTGNVEFDPDGFDWIMGEYTNPFDTLYMAGNTVTVESTGNLTIGGLNIQIIAPVGGSVGINGGDLFSAYGDNAVDLQAGTKTLIFDSAGELEISGNPGTAGQALVSAGPGGEAGWAGPFLPLTLTGATTVNTGAHNLFLGPSAGNGLTATPTLAGAQWSSGTNVSGFTTGANFVSIFNGPSGEEVLAVDPGILRIKLASGSTGQYLKLVNSSTGEVGWDTPSGSGGVSDGDYGDITVSSSGTVWTIDNAAVTFAKIQDADALSVIGRSANSSGVLDEIAAGTDNNILRRSGTSIGFGSINLASSDAVGASILPTANGGTGSSTFPGWLLASGGTASGDNTFAMGTNALAFTSTRVSLNFGFSSTWTATADNQLALRTLGTITHSGTSGRTLIGVQLGLGINSGATNQISTAVQIVPAFAYNSAGGQPIGIDYAPAISGSQASAAQTNHIAARFQSGAVIIGGTTLTNTSTLLDLQSTTKGIVLPRVTNIASVATPVSGMIAYDAATNKFNFRENAAWVQIGSGTVTSVSGTTDRITSTGGATPVIDISASYVGQASITTLGTVTTGVWNGTDVALANIVPSSAASKLLGRGDSGAGDFEEITIGSGLTMTGTTLSATGGGGGGLTPDTQSGTTYTIVSGDDGKAIQFTNAAGCTVTLPDGLSSGLGFVAFKAAGAGDIVFVPDTTLLTPGGEDTLTLTNGSASFLNVGSDVWRGTLQTSTGTVTSVDLASVGLSDIFTISNNPVTSSGTLTLTAVDPGADRLVFWDDSGSEITYATLGNGLSFTTTTINAQFGGSGGTTDNALIRADGTGGGLLQSSAVVLSDTADLTLGLSGTSGSSRSISAAGSASDIGIALVAKGAGSVLLGNGGATFSVGLQSSSINRIILQTSATDQTISGGLEGNSFVIEGADSATTGVAGSHVEILAGDATTGNANGGNVIIRGGQGVGTGVDGYVMLDQLPSSDPGVPGALYHSSGTLMVSL